VYEAGLAKEEEALGAGDAEVEEEGCKGDPSRGAAPRVEAARDRLELREEEVEGKE
jgi:hypothetical protein